MATRAERVERIRSKHEYLAEKHGQASDRLHKESREAVEGIPPGQPILVGHHSERRHRRHLDRSWNKLGQAVAAEKKADHHAGLAATADCQGISYRDDDAIELLEEKVAKLEKRRDENKHLNALCRKALKAHPCPREQAHQMNTEDLPAIAELRKLIRESIAAGKFSSGGTISDASARDLLYPTYSFVKPGVDLTSDGRKIREAKKRIARLKADAAREPHKRRCGNVGGDGIYFETQENEEYRSIELHFAGKPDENVRDWMKRHGFRWVRTAGCWSRRNDARTEARIAHLLEKGPEGWCA